MSKLGFSVFFRNRLEKEIEIERGVFCSVSLKSLDRKLSEILTEATWSAVREVQLVAGFGRGRFGLENLPFLLCTGRILTLQATTTGGGSTVLERDCC